MAELELTDLDAHPELTKQVLELLRGCPPGRRHATIGEPSRMGLEPRSEDLERCLGILIGRVGGEVRGVLGLCTYSDRQVTLWGPVVHRGHIREGVAGRMLDEARTALRDGGYESVRVLVDTRNRAARSFFLAKGLTTWRDNHVYERRLRPEDRAEGGVSVARPSDHDEITRLLLGAFPDSGHVERPLAEHERDGYRHHILQDAGTIIGAAAVQASPGRSWLTLIAIDPRYRGQGLGKALLRGVVAGEAALGTHRLGLEVLADNAAAVALYESMGFSRSWTATIMTGPV